MSIVAPKGRKHLSADALFRLVRNSFAGIPDHRPDDTGISGTDALMAAFAMFSLKSPSLLTFDKERVAGNLHTIYGIAHAPCDTYMRVSGFCARSRSKKIGTSSGPWRQSPRPTQRHCSWCSAAVRR